MNGNARNLSLVVALFLFISAFAAYGTAIAQNRDKNKAAVLKQERRAGAGLENKKTADPILFEAAFEEDILNIPFIESDTDAVEYTQVYKPFSETIEGFGKNLSRAMKNANGEYAAFALKYGAKFREENDSASKKIAANRDKNRVESLKSIFDILTDEHKKIIESQHELMSNKFENMFSSFISAYGVQKGFMLKDTVYESETSELSLALGSFEVEIKEKRSKIKKQIDLKFSNFESEISAGEKNGDL